MPANKSSFKLAIIKNVERRSFLLVSTVSVDLGGFDEVVPPPGLPASH
jgi:hypothetical protein